MDFQAASFPKWFLWIGLLSLTPLTFNLGGGGGGRGHGGSSMLAEGLRCQVCFFFPARNGSDFHEGGCEQTLFECNSINDTKKAKQYLEWEMYYALPHAHHHHKAIEAAFNNGSQLPGRSFKSNQHPLLKHSGDAPGNYSDFYGTRNLHSDDGTLDLSTIKFVCIRVRNASVPAEPPIQREAFISTCIPLSSKSPGSLKVSKELQSITHLDIGFNKTKDQPGSGEGYVCDNSNAQQCGGASENKLDSATTENDLKCPICFYKKGAGGEDKCSEGSKMSCNSWDDYFATLGKYRGQVHDLYPETIPVDGIAPGKEDKAEIKDGGRPGGVYTLKCVRFEGYMSGVNDSIGGGACVMDIDNKLPASKKKHAFKGGYIAYLTVDGQAVICDHSNPGDCGAKLPEGPPIEAQGGDNATDGATDNANATSSGEGTNTTQTPGGGGSGGGDSGGARFMSSGVVIVSAVLTGSIFLIRFANQ